LHLKICKWDGVKHEEAPPYFFAGSELPKHKFEHKMMPTYDKLVQHGVTNTDDHAKKL
jgi:hypothetical protein